MQRAEISSVSLERLPGGSDFKDQLGTVRDPDKDLCCLRPHTGLNFAWLRGRHVGTGQIFSLFSCQLRISAL